MPNAEQLEPINRVREAVKDSQEYKRHKEEAKEYLTEDYLIHRFLCARNYNGSKATKMLRNHIAWRYERYELYHQEHITRFRYRPFELRAQEFEELC